MIKNAMKAAAAINEQLLDLFTPEQEIRPIWAAPLLSDYCDIWSTMDDEAFCEALSDQERRAWEYMTQLS